MYVNEERPLISLARDRNVRRKSLFTSKCETLTKDELNTWYRQEMLSAPNRDKYFQLSHDGRPSTQTFTNRHEEHLALAIFNCHVIGNPGLQLPDSSELNLLDYQFPLKSKRADKYVGKIDLLGINKGQVTVVELKSSNGTDTPLRATIEALAYAAIVQANIPKIRQEVKAKWNQEIKKDEPMIIVMAPVNYWHQYNSCHNWKRQMQLVVDNIQKESGVVVSLVSLMHSDFVHGNRENKPQLKGAIICKNALKEFA